MNLMYCANEGVFDGVFLSILSAVESASCPIHAYIFTMDLTEMNPAYQRISANQILKLSKIVKQYNPMNIVTLIDATKEFKEKIGTSKNLATGYTPYTLLRLRFTSFEMPYYIFYVDADTCFFHDFSSLYSSIYLRVWQE